LQPSTILDIKLKSQHAAIAQLRRINTMPPKSKANPSSSPLKTTYLLAYNAVSAMLWLSVLGRVVTIGATQGVGSGKVYQGTEEFARLTQTGAVLEIVHSLLGTKLRFSLIAYHLYLGFTEWTE
jgi:hypothetical protein